MQVHQFPGISVPVRAVTSATKLAGAFIRESKEGKRRGEGLDGLARRA